MNHFEDKQEAKRQRYLDLADRNEAKSASEFKRADLSESATGIPLGQPILVGHHSEKRHRRTLERADNAMRRSIEADDKATYYRGKAAGVGKAGISSDDPEAVQKLQAKIDKATARQTMMKACNKIIRDKNAGSTEDKAREAKILRLRAEGLSEASASALLEPDFCGRLGFASYELTNNNANIRRMRQRIEQLKQAPTETTEEQRGNVTVIQNADENRVQLVFPGKPSAEVRQTLKAHGFRWSRYNGAWQRHLNNAGTYAAEQVLAEIGKQE